MKGESQTSRFGSDRHSPRLAELIGAAQPTDFDADTLSIARYFLADTLATGIAGICNPAADGVLAAMKAAAGPGDIACLGRADVRLPPLEAAVVNGFQIHCLEWDALHEPSVVIALCATVGALSCDIQRRQASVGDLLTAFIVGVETAVFFGSAAATAPRFFRPSAAGVMGAVAAVAKLRGFDLAGIKNALGLAYSQAGGTMQAHWEGSEALALQVGFASRAALTAADLVEHGVSGPHDVVSGKFGYFALFETPDDLDAALSAWARPWKITEVAHKPYPAGRATQAVLTALTQLRSEREIAAEDVAELRADVPSLIGLLVGRPYQPDMSPSYARLCLQYVASRMLLDGEVDPRKFTVDQFDEPAIAALAKRIECFVDDNPDPNALGPQTVTLVMTDGTELRCDVPVPLGAPGNPLSRDQRIDKIARCFAAADWPADSAKFLARCESEPLAAPAISIFNALEDR